MGVVVWAHRRQRQQIEANKAEIHELREELKAAMIIAHALNQPPPDPPVPTQQRRRGDHLSIVRYPTLVAGAAMAVDWTVARLRTRPPLRMVAAGALAGAAGLAGILVAPGPPGLTPEDFDVNEPPRSGFALPLDPQAEPSPTVSIQRTQSPTPTEPAGAGAARDQSTPGSDDVDEPPPDLPTESPTPSGTPSPTPTRTRTHSPTPTVTPQPPTPSPTPTQPPTSPPPSTPPPPTPTPSPSPSPSPTEDRRFLLCLELPPIAERLCVLELGQG